MASTRPRVAILDDDPEVASVMEALLAEEGFDGDTPSLESADPLELLVAGGYDMAIVDLHGLGPDGGLALVRRARTDARLAHLPVLICSADVRLLREHTAELSRIPAVACLEKPFRIEMLVDALRRLLDGAIGPTHPAGQAR
jgi:DNA-binding response OmpR family regulator